MIEGIALKRTPLNGGTRFLIFKLPALLYMALIYYLSSGPITSPTINAIPDYYLHSLGYSVLAVLIFWALHQGLDAAKGAGGYSLPVLITILYGLSDEFHQRFVTSRDSSIKDAIADAGGALLGMLFIMLAARLVSSFRRTHPN